MPILLPRSLLSWLPLCVAGWALCAVSAGALAQAGGNQTFSGIYTCIDAQGRRLTSDRPIMECIDREQRELGRSGTVRRVIPPVQTGAEREAQQAREREAALERERALDALRRDQALLARYPDKAAHEAGRQQALAQTQITLNAAEQRIAELTAQRKTLDDELEFYRNDPSRTPVRLRRSVEDNEREMRTQRSAIVNQQEERKRIHARFDEEARRLQPLWQAAAAGSPPAAADH
ncbi:MAG: hypothetical protein FWG56_00350 [Desulfovibrionaceae bacterium]|nr:hypothetical protein [Desulfovibrionaceae bacterium]